MPTLASFLYAAASRHGARPALSMDDQVLTYAELDASANRIANLLIRQGVRIGDRVAMWMPKSLEAITSIWGILKAGAAFVPIDPARPCHGLRPSRVIARSGLWSRRWTAPMICTMNSAPLRRCARFSIPAMALVLFASAVVLSDME